MASTAVLALTTMATNSSNDTAGGEEEGGPPINYTVEERVILGIFLVLLVILTIAGNSVVVAAIATFKQLRTLTNYFVLSLAIADILVAMTVMPFGVYHQMNNSVFELGRTVCLLSFSMDVMFTTTSILHLACMCADRYLAVCNPFFYHQRMTKKTVTILLVLCWVLPMFISFLPIMNGWNSLGIEQYWLPEEVPACVPLVNKGFALVCSSIAFFIPVFLMIGMNTKIAVVARRQARQIRALEVQTAHLGGPKKNNSSRNETKAAFTLGIVTLAFSICWFPFFIMNIIDPFIEYTIAYYAWTVALWLGYLNSTLNPFLYFIFNTKFRKAFIKLLTCRQCRKNKDYEDTYGKTVMTGAGSSDD